MEIIIVRNRKVGIIVLSSVICGAFISLILALGVFGGATEPIITGGTLLGFSIGWLLLAVLSSKYTDQPQKWAYFPATYMAVVGLFFLLLKPGNGFITNFGWVWPITLVALVIWMYRQSKINLHSRTRKWLIYPIFIILLISALGGTYETIQEKVDQKNLHMQGQLVDVGRYRLHINCTGSGSPTVVLESGLGEPSTAMTAWIAPAVAHDTRVCSYDRAGRGWSDPSPTPQDGIQLASALHTLLVNAHEQGPYILAGHSAGGAYVQTFAAKYPDDVAGLVLLDSMSPYQYTKLPGWSAFYSGFRRTGALFPSLSRIGVGRIAYGSAYANMPASARAEERAFWASPSLQRSQRDEFSVIKSALEQAQELKSLGDKPLMIVSGQKGEQAGWGALQDQMVTLSSNSAHITIQGATHADIPENKDVATKSAQAILQVVEAVRTGKTLVKE